VGVDEVEALAHQRLLVVEDHAVEVDEALGVDEDADGRGVGEGGVKVSLGEGVDAVALAGLGVELDVVAEAGATAAGDAHSEASGVGGDVLLGHGDANALQRAQRNLDALGARAFPFRGEDGRSGRSGGRRCGHAAFRGLGLEGNHGHNRSKTNTEILSRTTAQNDGAGIAEKEISGLRRQQP
jgi:hypothetical protein